MTIRLLPFITLLMLVTAAIIALIAMSPTETSARSDDGPTRHLPNCPNNDSSTYKYTCLGEDKSTVYVLMNEIEIGTEYRYKANISDTYAKRNDGHHVCEGYGFYDYETLNHRIFDWRYFTARSTHEVRTAYLSQDHECDAEDRVVSWEIHTNHAVHGWIVRGTKALVLNTRQNGQQHPVMHEQAFVIHHDEALHMRYFVVSWHFDEGHGYDANDTFEWRIDTPDNLSSCDTQHIGRTYSFTGDDIAENHHYVIGYIRGIQVVLLTTTSWR